MGNLGVDENGYKHLQSLIANPQLPHITNTWTAKMWNSQDINACLAVVAQSLEIRGKRGCDETELRLREMLNKHMKKVQEEEARTKDVSSSPFNNQIINGIRWRQ